MYAIKWSWIKGKRYFLTVQIYVIDFSKYDASNFQIETSIYLFIYFQKLLSFKDFVACLA